jgi:hypothetical protein
MDKQTDTDTKSANYLELICHRCRRNIHILFEGTPPPVDTDIIEGNESSGTSPSTNSSISPNSLTWRELMKVADDENALPPEQEIASLPIPVIPSSGFSIFKRNTVSLGKPTNMGTVKSTSSPRAMITTNQQRSQTVQQQVEYDRWRFRNNLFLTKLCQYASKDDHIENLLCLECAESLMGKLHNDYAELTEELEQYESFMKTEGGSCLVNDSDEEETLLQELRKLEEEEQTLRQDLATLSSEETELKKKDEEWEAHMQEWRQQESRYWLEFNTFQLHYQSFEQEREATQQKIAHVSRELERLNSTNVFNDAFHIWYEGHFGTINNFRLGKLPTQNVEWNEINAAWGQAALLLCTLARYKKFSFTRHRIIPMGSFSKVELLSDSGGTIYELYGGGGGLFWASRFDKAMVGFLQCLKEFADYAVQQDSTFELPYK